MANDNTITIVHTPADHETDDLRRMCDFRAKPSTDGLTLEGYGAVFNTWTEITDRAGTFQEQIAPGAFKRTLSHRMPVLQFDHGHHPLIGSIPLGRFTRLEEDDNGLQVRARLSDNWLIEPVRDAIRDGGITGMSFRFRVVDDRWDTDDAGIERRTIREVELYEVGPVVFPAYEATTVGVRARQTVHALTDPEVRREVATLLALGTDQLRTLGDESPATTDTPAPQGTVPADETPTTGHVPSPRTPAQRRALAALHGIKETPS